MKQQWKGVGSYGTLGLEVALSILVGLFIGQRLDAWLDTAPYLSVLWFFFGVGAAVNAVRRAWKAMQADAAREEREEGNPAQQFVDVEKQEKRASEDDRWAHGDASEDAGNEAGPRKKEHDER